MAGLPSGRNQEAAGLTMAFSGKQRPRIRSSFPGLCPSPSLPSPTARTLSLLPFGRCIVTTFTILFFSSLSAAFHLSSPPLSLRHHLGLPPFSFSPSLYITGCPRPSPSAHKPRRYLLTRTALSPDHPPRTSSSSPPPSFPITKLTRLVEKLEEADIGLVP